MPDEQYYFVKTPNVIELHAQLLSKLVRVIKYRAVFPDCHAIKKDRYSLAGIIPPMLNSITFDLRSQKAECVDINVTGGRHVSKN